MKSITIHNLDDSMDSLIRKKATEEGLSLNKTIKKLLRQTLGLSKRETVNVHENYSDLFGTWDKKDIDEFNKNTADFEKIFEDDWK